MDYTNFFKQVLREDETVLMTAKGMRKPYVLKRILVPFIIFMFFTTLFTILALGLPYRPTGDTFFGKPEYEGFPPVVTIVFACVTFCIFLLVLILSISGSSKYYVCLTNKRVIVRSGIINVGYANFSIENVSGNISVSCVRSIFDDKDPSSCKVSCNIELMPVGHGRLNIFLASISNGYDFAKKLEDTIMTNSKASIKKFSNVKE